MIFYRYFDYFVIPLLVANGQNELVGEIVYCVSDNVWFERAKLLELSPKKIQDKVLVTKDVVEQHYGQFE